MRAVYTWLWTVATAARSGVDCGMAGPAQHFVTEAEYLAFDLANEGKHEYVNGEIIAMAGPSEAHLVLTGNAYAALHAELKGGPCRPFVSDCRTHIDETGLYAYPDVLVVCGEREFAATNPPTLLNPTVIVEVLSESTQNYDRGAKLEHYRRRASVQAVLLIDSRRRWVNSYARNADGSWTLLDIVGGDVQIACLGIAVSMDDLYEGVEGTIGWG